MLSPVGRRRRVARPSVGAASAAAAQRRGAVRRAGEPSARCGIVRLTEPEGLATTYTLAPTRAPSRSRRAPSSPHRIERAVAAHANAPISISTRTRCTARRCGLHSYRSLIGKLPARRGRPPPRIAATVRAVAAWIDEYNRDRIHGGPKYRTWPPGWHLVTGDLQALGKALPQR